MPSMEKLRVSLVLDSFDYYAIEQPTKQRHGDVSIMHQWLCERCRIAFKNAWQSHLQYFLVINLKCPIDVR